MIQIDSLTIERAKKLREQAQKDFGPDHAITGCIKHLLNCLLNPKPKMLQSGKKKIKSALFGLNGNSAREEMFEETLGEISRDIDRALEKQKYSGSESRIFWGEW